MPSLSYTTAKQLADSFIEHSSIMEQHHEAMDCRECEDFLQVGIDAFHWLMRADVGIRYAMLNDQEGYDEALVESIATLIVDWLKPCESANRWLADQESRGFTVDNAEEFRRCKVEVQAIVSHLQDEDETLTPAMEELRDQALEDYANGQTSAFVPGAE